MIARKLFVFILIFFIATGICFATRAGRNIVVHHTKTTIVNDEYEVRYSGMINVVGLTKSTFEYVARNAFDSRRLSIRKYKLELEADGCYPEYRLGMVEAKSIDDINEALDEIDNYREGGDRDKNKPQKSATRQSANEKIETESCTYDIYVERLKEFEETLKELTEPRDVEVKMLGQPRKIKADNGKEKMIYRFNLTGKSCDIEFILNELDQKFNDPLEDRD